MKIACLQMKVQFADPEENFSRAEELIRSAMAQTPKPDVLVLPETWNTGSFPKKELRELSDRNCEQVQTRIGTLAAKYAVNIVAGSVSNLREGNVYNTACIFDRTGACIATYDKTHLFTPTGEDRYYEKGDSLCSFVLDGVQCGILICYDVRFPELVRSLCLDGVQMLFVVSQWPMVRVNQLRSLTVARAIENQMFVVCCNACGTAKEIVFGGGSAVIDPSGSTLALAADAEQIITAACNLTMLQEIRDAIPVLRDRRPEIYRL